MTTVRRAVLFDYGGVLTAPVKESFAAFEQEVGIPIGRSFQVLVDASRTSGGGLIGALERGEILVQDFDAELTHLLRQDGHEVDGGELLAGLFKAATPAGGLWDVVGQLRAAGVPVGLLSNSWGTHVYPRRELDERFDVVVLSGEVGQRKPDPAIYRLASSRLGVAPEHCAFVDDLERNIEAARSLGMFGIVHDGDDQATAAALAGYLGIELRPG